MAAHVKSMLHKVLQSWWLPRCGGGSPVRSWGVLARLPPPKMVEPWTHTGKSGESCCWRQVIYGVNGFKLMWKVCLNRNMQIAARNGNLEIAGADEGRNMLINELKSDWISQADVPQGKHIERRQNGASLCDRSLQPQKMENKCRRSQTEQNLGQQCHWHQGEDKQYLANMLYCSLKGDWENVAAFNREGYCWKLTIVEVDLKWQF